MPSFHGKANYRDSKSTAKMRQLLTRDVYFKEEKALKGTEIS